MLLVIDNYDSFTYNIVHYLQELGAQVQVVRNDEKTLAELQSLAPERILLSPGPGNPDNAGITLEVIEQFAGSVPILGVCLGHQAIGQAFGAKVVQAAEVMHGKVSRVHNSQKGVFKGLYQSFNATRYHSLVLAQASLPECLEVTAWTSDRRGEREEIMAVRHKHLPVEGVQFHPESILTEQGHALLKNFIGG